MRASLIAAAAVGLFTALPASALTTIFVTTLSSAGESVSDSGQDVAYGIGANVNLSRTSYLQASWTSHYDDDGVKLEGLGVAWGMKF